MTPPRPLTTTEAADELGVTPRRIVAMINAGQIKAEKRGRAWFIHPHALKVKAVADRGGAGRPPRKGKR